MKIVEGHRIVSRSEWLAERKAFLAEEKAFTKARDALSRRRLELPWVKIEKSYEFDGPEGRQSLADLFDGRSQLIVQHFMFGPDWTEGCVGCSFNADHADGALPHLAGRDAAFAAVSRTPIAELEKYRARMGWRFNWVSSLESDFNFDFDVSFRKEDVAAGKARYNFRPYDGEMEDLSGYSSFYRNAQGEIFHAYSVYARGDEILCTAYMYLDLLAPLGRNEAGLEYPMAWWRHHDNYEDTRAETKSCCA
jgi:predicted dithiol-disulfide oxidoreductase (DUF899 family)